MNIRVNQVNLNVKQVNIRVKQVNLSLLFSLVGKETPYNPYTPSPHKGYGVYYGGLR